MQKPTLLKDQGPSLGQENVFGVRKLGGSKGRNVVLLVGRGEACLGPRIKAGGSPFEVIVGQLDQQGMGGNDQVLTTTPIRLWALKAVHLILVGGKGIAAIGIVSEDSPVGVDTGKGAHVGTADALDGKPAIVLLVTDAHNIGVILIFLVVLERRITKSILQNVIDSFLDFLGKSSVSIVLGPFCSSCEILISTCHAKVFSGCDELVALGRSQDV